MTTPHSPHLDGSVGVDYRKTVHEIDKFYKQFQAKMCRLQPTSPGPESDYILYGDVDLQSIEIRQATQRRPRHPWISGRDIADNDGLPPNAREMIREYEYVARRAEQHRPLRITHQVFDAYRDSLIHGSRYGPLIDSWVLVWFVPPERHKYQLVGNCQLGNMHFRPAIDTHPGMRAESDHLTLVLAAVGLPPDLEKSVREYLGFPATMRSV